MLGFGYPISPEWAPREGSELATWIVGLIMVVLFLAMWAWTARPTVRPPATRDDEVEVQEAA